MTATAALEIERKYDVTPTAQVPDLSGLPGVERVAEPQEHLLEATYYDTADLRLRSAGITLRRRTGGDDAGWHLKVPVAGEREELHVPADDSVPDEPVPEQLLRLVRAHSRTAPLLPAARLTTRRTVHRLLDGDGNVMAELADDAVTGRPLPDGDTVTWREWEVELKTGDRTLLEAVQRRVSAADAVPSSSGSKAGRVLTRRPQPAGEPPWWAVADGGTDELGGRVSAAAAVQRHLAEQVAELVERDPQVRRDLPDAVHKMRVATRRLRSALRTFRPLLDRQRTDPVRAELRELAGQLGAARDTEVLHARLKALVAAEPPDLVLGGVVRRIDLVMTERYRRAYAQAVAALDGERYLRLLDDLHALAADPPFTDAARGPAREVLPPLVRRTWKRLDRSLQSAVAAGPGPERDELVHEARKDAKRARYAAEAVTPVFGRPAKAFAEAAEHLQEVLGDVQDGTVNRALLREFGARGHLAGENGFTFGRLHALEQVRAQAAVAALPRAHRVASKRRLRRWFES